MKKLLAALVIAVFGLVSLGVGNAAEAAQKRAASKKSVTKKSSARKLSSKKKVRVSRIAKSKRKVSVSRKAVAKKRVSKRRASTKASRRAKRSVAMAPRLARLPKARSAPGALSMPRLPESDSDERILAARAYAMDGATFYQGGRRIRVKGIDAGGRDVSSEHAKQRLQRLLDSGHLQVEPVAADPAGNMLSVVRVNGRNVADMVQTN